jgi:hypothetical protein
MAEGKICSQLSGCFAEGALPQCTDILEGRLFEVKLFFHEDSTGWEIGGGFDGQTRRRGAPTRRFFPARSESEYCRAELHQNAKLEEVSILY